MYNVEGPHHLWHVDGNHKLIKFNLVIHAGIDGFSRTIVYAKCADNNTAETALEAFKVGISKYGCPSRVRTDMGGENVLIADYMLETKGLNRGSILTGKSTHNQRIERQWRDMSKEVIQFYRNLFFGISDVLERQYNASFGEMLPIFCLHYMFRSRIDADLERYIEAWNMHKIRTEKNKSPYRLLHEYNYVSAAIEVDDFYGAEDILDEDEQQQFQPIDHVQQVEVNAVMCPLNEVQLIDVQTRFSPFNLWDTNLQQRFFEMYVYCRNLIVA